MDNEEVITLGYDDEVSVEIDTFDPGSDDVVVRITHNSHMEFARWLRFDMAPGRDRQAKINELIAALEIVKARG